MSHIFVVIYGFTPDEMLQNNIVTLSINGFTVGAGRYIHSEKDGYVFFKRKILN